MPNCCPLITFWSRRCVHKIDGFTENAIFDDLGMQFLKVLLEQSVFEMGTIQFKFLQ